MTSTAARAALYSQETDKVFLYLVTINHPNLDAPLRVVANTEDITSRGNLYKAFSFHINFPNAEPDQAPRARVQISAVSDPTDPDTNIVLILRSLGPVAPTITLETVLVDQPDVLERSAPDLQLLSADFDTATIEGDLSYEPLMSESYPGDAYSPALWPGVFA